MQILRLPGLDVYYADSAQHLITAGQDLKDLDRDLAVRRVKMTCNIC